MKINNINPLEPGRQDVRSVEHASDPFARQLVFRQELSRLSNDQQQKQLAAMADEIDRQGEKLARTGDIREVERYRALIRQFIDEIVSNGYAFSKENSMAPRGRHRIFATVKTINDKLDELAKRVLSEQSDNIDLLARVDEIRGLILDMLL